jgi:NAD+ diphosphatase
MLGYSAVAGNDRICRNDNELEDTLWLDRQQVSEWLAVGRFKPPPVISISFRLIEDWFDRESDIPLRAVCQQTG